MPATAFQPACGLAGYEIEANAGWASSGRAAGRQGTTAVVDEGGVRAAIRGRLELRAPRVRSSARKANCEERWNAGNVSRTSSLGEVEFRYFCTKSPAGVLLADGKSVSVDRRPQ